MNPQQIELVRTSFGQVAPIASKAAELFYGRLFELDPSLRPLFKGNMAEQGNKLMSMIGGAVALLDQPEKLMPVVEDLGRRHVAYGVQDEHYATVGSALIWTLKQGLGSGFTPEIETAWTTVYGVLSDTMQKASKEMF
jgi:hemoglobin-like flavoprotein